MRAAAGVAIGIALLALSGCSDTAPPNRVHGTRLTIYASVPLEGASADSAEAVLNGAGIALDQIADRIGRYHIVFRTLDDATIKAHGWDPGQTEANARIAAADRGTVGYIGDFDSGASAISIPLLNRAQIAQVSPSSTAVGLTTDAAGASPGEPLKYYPTGSRTYARVVPDDTVQANVQVSLQQDYGCSRTYVIDDGEVDGTETATSFEAAAQRAGLVIAGTSAFVRHATDYTAFAAGVAAAAPDCVFISALTESGAPLVAAQLGAALPHARFFCSASLGESAFADPALGGIPLSLDRRVLVTMPALGPADYPPAGRAFLRLYSAQFGAPEPSAIFGYEAMSLLLQAISRASHAGRRPVLRSRVVAALMSTRDHQGAIGSYSIDRDGDTTIRRYGVWRVVGGHLTFWRALEG
ncbi:MAG TPA: branched-chain amino acid ABC transporter substrate-binding protein [Solirubrobacteraceae bacterium]|nr:branched-chain amino acid ABC transporter substrate-binding protein [Solirubrobacteraceae bacterium]